MRRDSLDRVIVLAIAAATFLTGLGATHLWDEDEGYFAGTAAEMFRSGAWLVPSFNGALFAHKPPLMYWGMEAGFSLLGHGEWGARLGSAVFGVLTALLTRELGTRLFGRRAGLLAGAAMGSNVMFTVVARAATADAYLTCAFTAAVTAWVHWSPGFARNPDGTGTAPRVSGPGNWIPDGRRGLVFAYLAMAVALLTKGPVGVLLPMTILAAFAAWESGQGTGGPGVQARRAIAALPGTVWRMRPVMALLVVGVAAGWWFVAVQVQGPGDFLGEFLGFHNIQRFLRPMEHHSGPLVYYVPVIWVGFFPWSIFLLPAIAWLRRRLARGTESAVSHRERAAWHLMFWWCAVVLVFFSLSQTKLPNYILPLYPALAVTAGACLASWTEHATWPWGWWARLAFRSLASVGLAFLVLVPAVSLLHYDGLPLLVYAQVHPELSRALWPVGLVGVPLLVGGWLCLSAVGRGAAAHMVTTFMIMAPAFCLALLMVAAAYVNRFQSSPAVAAAILERTGGASARVATFHLNSPTLVFYLRQTVPSLAENDLRGHLAHEDGLLVTTDEGLDAMPADVRTALVPVYTRARFPKPGTVMVLARRP